jgi:SAM-dependent methyltransferase
VRRYCRHRNTILDLGARRSLIVGIDSPTEHDASLGFSSPSLGQFIQNRHLAVFGSGEHLPFKPETFDVVLMIEVIEHIERDQEGLKEIHDILRLGGILLLTTPKGETFPIPAKYDIRQYTPMAMENLVGNFFEIERFWRLFPKGRLWHKSVKSIKNMIQNKYILSLIWHVVLVQIYWLYVGWRFITHNGADTTTICLVAKKKSEP